MIGSLSIGAGGFVAALTVYVLLTTILLSVWRFGDVARPLALATGISALWAAVWVTHYPVDNPDDGLSTLTEIARALAWLLAVITMLRVAVGSNLAGQIRSRYGIFVAIVAALPIGFFLYVADEPAWVSLWICAGFLVSLLIILATEQLYRNAPFEARTGITYISIGIAGIFLYDLILYSVIIAGGTVAPDYWSARGYISVLLATPLVLGIWRRSRKQPGGQMPRQIVFYTFGIVTIATYTLIVVLGHRYVQSRGGSWSGVGGILIIVAAAVAALVLIASASARARVRVFLMKTFLQFKYDYRKEWLRFISTLSKSGMADAGETAVRAVAQIVNSPGGVVWIQELSSNSYFSVGSWRCEDSNTAPISASSSLVKFLRERQWVIDFEEMKRYPDRYEELPLDELKYGDGDWWLVVPLFLGKRLYGFIILLKPRVVPSLNFEDHDLLRTVGSHVGMHINQAESDKRMAESRQFGAYNRLTAFLMHDLNNLIAQQSLVVKNAERFRSNPKFVDDAIDTIAHSVSRMKRLMEQLNKGSEEAMQQPTDLKDALQRAISRCTARLPAPTTDIDEQPVLLVADPERLTTVFEHIIRNAQDATDQSGQIRVAVAVQNGEAVVSIKDTGLGMSSDFIRERLFRPFDSTKGSQSMGIGAYQARDYVRMLDGHIEVYSVVGVGTEFSIRLPLPE